MFSGGLVDEPGNPTQPTSARPASRLGLQYLLVLAAAMLLYVATVAPGVLWQDNGLVQVRVLRRDLVGDLGLALSHPLYYVIALAFQGLPLSESALKTNLVSAVFGAVTVANLFLLLALATRARVPAVVGALTLAVAHTFWQHAALAEVYSLTSALLVGELLCAWLFTHTRRSRWLVLLFLVNGVGVSNHMLAMLSLACYLGLLTWGLAARVVQPRVLPACAAAWLLGAAFFLYLIASEIGAGAGVRATLHSALFGVEFRGNVLNTADIARLLRNGLLYLGLNFPTPSAALALFGWGTLGASRTRPFRATVITLLGVHLVWAVHYDIVDQYTCFIPAIVLLAFLIGVGAARVRTRWPALRGGWLLASAIVPVLVYAILPTAARTAGVHLGVRREVPYRDSYSYFLVPWKNGYRGAERFAREVHEFLPEGAVLLADASTARPLHYFQLTGRWTKRIRVEPPLRRPNVTPRPAESVLRDELEAGLVYVVTPVEGYCPDWLLERYEVERAGLVYRVVGPKRRPRLCANRAATARA
jgi:hypothetical protein